MVDIKERLNEGYIQTNIIIEILGKPKEHVEKSLKLYLEKIKANKEFEIIKSHMVDIKELEDGMFSTFAELEMLFKNIPALIGFCFDYMPSSIEIVAPNEAKLTNKTISDFMNDLQARMHQVDMRLKNAVNTIEFLKKNLNHSLKNCIKLGLVTGPKTLSEIEKYSGMGEGNAKVMVDQMIQEKLIEEKEGKYSISIKNES